MQQWGKQTVCAAEGTWWFLITARRDELLQGKEEINVFHRLSEICGKALF